MRKEGSSVVASHVTVSIVGLDCAVHQNLICILYNLRSKLFYFIFIGIGHPLLPF